MQISLRVWTVGITIDGVIVIREGMDSKDLIKYATFQCGTNPQKNYLIREYIGTLKTFH